MHPTSHLSPGKCIQVISLRAGAFGCSTGWVAAAAVSARPQGSTHRLSVQPAGLRRCVCLSLFPAHRHLTHCSLVCCDCRSSFPRTAAIRRLNARAGPTRVSGRHGGVQAIRTKRMLQCSCLPVWGSLPPTPPHPTPMQASVTQAGSACALCPLPASSLLQLCSRPLRPPSRPGLQASAKRTSSTCGETRSS